MNSSIITTPQWSDARKRAMGEFMPIETRPDRNIALGKRLALAREVLGFGRNKKPGPLGGQREFAINAGVKPNTYNQYERGQNYPTVEAMEQLCNRYPGLTLDWIYRASYEGMARDLIERIQQLLAGEAIPTVLTEQQAPRQRAPAMPPMKVVEPRRRRA